MHATTFHTNSTCLYHKVKMYFQGKQSLYRLLMAFFVLILTPSLSQNLKAQNPEYDVIHTVQKGENLFRISKAYQTTVEALVKLNELSSAEKIYVNQELLIQKGTLGNLPENSIYQRVAGNKDRTFYAWENDASNDSRRIRESSYQTGNNARYGQSRGAAENTSVSYRQSSTNYTYAYGFDRFNSTDFESYVVQDTDPEVLEIIDRLDEKIGQVQYDSYGRRIRPSQSIPKRSNHARMTYRGAHGGNTSSFRRAKGAIDNPIYREKVRDQLAGTVYYYRVKKGDSLLSIALAHETSTAEIIEMNELKDYDLLVGSTLKIVKRD